MADSIIPCPAPIIDCGYITSGTLTAGATNDLTVTFTKRFTATPFILPTINTNSGTTGNDMLFITSVNNASATGCTIKVRNATDGNIDLSSSRRVNWIAIGY